MRRKMVLLLVITALLNSNIYQIAETAPEDEIIGRMISQRLGCTVAKAADAENEIIENAENTLTDEIETKESVEKPEVKPKEESEEESEVKPGEETAEETEILKDTETDGIKLREDRDRTEQEMVEEAKEQDCIYNVSFPTMSKVYLDPGNLSGRGQVFSDEFEVENYGNTDIAIKIKNINVYYCSTEKVYQLSEKAADMNNVKRIDVDIVWKNIKENTETVLDVVESSPDEYVLVLKAAQYTEDGQLIGMNEGSKGMFYFTGSLNPNPELVWDDSDVSVSFDYEIVNVEKHEPAETQETVKELEQLEEEWENQNNIDENHITLEEPLQEDS